MAYAGYRVKVNGVIFNNPAPSKYSIIKNIMQTSAERVASGLLHVETAPHKPYKIFLTFPIMKLSQWRAYFNVLDNDYLTVDFYDENTDLYRTATMYCGELQPEELNLGTSEQWIQEISFNLIEY